MTKRNWLIILVLIFAAGALLSHRELVGQDQIGVRVSALGGNPAVYHSGQKVFLFRGLHSLITFTSKPVQFVMAGLGAMKITAADGQEFTVDCKLRYQVDGPEKLITTLGDDNPQHAVEQRLREILSQEMTTRLRDGNATLNQVQTRIIFTAEILHTLKQKMAQTGINILSFELLAW